MKDFVSNYGGFRLNFSNNWGISVQWKPGNYCDNYDLNSRSPKQEFLESNTAEIAIFDPNGDWVNFGCDTVEGYVSSLDVAIWIHKVALFDSRNNAKDVEEFVQQLQLELEELHND